MGALAVIAVPALGIAAAGSALALGIGVVAGGIKIANYRALQAARQGKPRPKGPYDVPQELDINSDGVYGYVPRKGSGLNDLPVDYTNRTSVAKARPVRQRYREDLRKKRDYARQLERSGASDEDIARALNEKRNADRMSTYSDRDQPKIRARNMRDYGREEGPSYDMLRSGTSEGTKQFNAPKTDREIIARAEARNPGGDAPRR